MIKIPFELKPFPSLKDVPKPIINIVFQNPNDENKVFQTIGILDTGADYCTLPSSTQLSLGLNLKEIGANIVPIGCACGNERFFAYKYKLNVSFYDINKKPFTKLLWVLFAKSKSDTYSLIGRNFMDMFTKITYDNNERKGYFEGRKTIDDINQD